MRKNWIGIPALMILLLLPSLSVAQGDDEILTPVAEEQLEQPDLGLDVPGIVTVQDKKNDAGDQLLVSFELPVDTEGIFAYRVYRRIAGELDENAWSLVKVIPADEPPEFIDGYDPEYPISQGVLYEYKISSATGDDEEFFGPVFEAGVVSSGEIYHTGKTRILIASLLFMILIFYYFGKAQKGIKMYMRPIAGIEAIDEAIGRATEMGKPILYVPGISSIADVATIASLTIMGRVAKKIALYQTPLIVPNRDPIVFTVAEEVVKQAYLEAGRPDAFDPDSVFFLTTSQFAFVAGVNGIMMREKPATNFYLGMFYAESLLLAETGTLSGAIQIAGTDAVTQLPFFITTCDYTLIGEELYAASAYLGREPKQIGALKGQDACKAIIMGFITVALIFGIVDVAANTHLLDWLRDLVTSPIIE